MESLLEYISSDFVWKFVKFGIVGLSGLFVDYGITFLFRELLKVQQYLSNAIGFSIAATTNYILNRIWTFQSSNPEIFVEFAEFFLISLIGLGLNTLVLWFIVSRFRINFYLSKAMAIAFVTFWNFFANAYITFNDIPLG